MSGELRVVHTIAGLKDRAGGVARSVPGLCEALARVGVHASLVSQAPAGIERQSLRLPDEHLVAVHLLHGYDWERLRFSYTPGLARGLAAALTSERPRIVHDHGLWLHMNHAVAAVSSTLGIARVVSPRGMLDGWSLAYRGLKKRIAWNAYQRADLATASGFSATSSLEAEGVRRLGFKQPIAVIPNGIDLPAPDATALTPEQPRERSVVFMSRLHPKKGLEDLVAAWRLLQPRGWRLVIAGPDEDGYGRTIRKAVEDAGMSASVTFPGAVHGREKSTLLHGADLFVLPSYSENFGIVVAEALAHRVPVITTTATPWQSLHEHDCGWSIAPGSESLREALSQAMAAGDERRRLMGKRGRDLVEREFSWAAVAERHVSFYRWLLGEGEMPAHVLQ